jgi:hypothetical protein
MRLVLLLGSVLGGLCGCGTSKWAMDHPAYAAKYDQPYPDDRADKSERIAKQLVDARHVAGNSGYYAGAAFADDPASGGVELGAFTYPTSWLSGRAGLSFLAGTGAKDFFTGMNVGLRTELPSRLSPFVGAGVYGGYSETTVEKDCGCRDSKIDGGLAALYPEVGWHFWLTGKTRLTTSAAYYFNTEGRNADFWLLGFSIGHVTDTE